MPDERLIVISVPQNLDTDLLVMGVPVREIGVFGLGPVGLSAVVKLFEVDVTLPFPLFGGILLSNFVMWVLGPVGFVALLRWKRRNPDVALLDALRFLASPRSYAAGCPDIAMVPYLYDPPPTAPARGRAPREEDEYVRRGSRSTRLRA